MSEEDVARSTPPRAFIRARESGEKILIVLSIPLAASIGS